MTKISNAIYMLERFIAVLLFIFMVVFIILGVAFRYFFHAPLSWTDEYALYTLVWATFVGGSMSIHKGKAAVVSIVMERIPRYLSRPLTSLGALITLLFCILLFVLSVQWIANPMVLMQRSSTGLSMIVPYAVIPLSFGFMSIHLLAILTAVIRSEQSEGT